jgi:hypothetical protein
MSEQEKVSTEPQGAQTPIPLEERINLSEWHNRRMVEISIMMLGMLKYFKGVNRTTLLELYRALDLARMIYPLEKDSLALDRKNLYVREFESIKDLDKFSDAQYEAMNMGKSAFLNLPLLGVCAVFALINLTFEDALVRAIALFIALLVSRFSLD